jgi:hypothetical protein
VQLFRQRFNKALKECRFIDNVLDLLLHIKFVLCEYFFLGGRGGGWLRVTYFMMGCTASCHTLSQGGREG